MDIRVCAIKPPEMQGKLLMRLNIEGVMIDAGKWDLITRLFFVLILITSITDIVTSLWLEIDSLHIVHCLLYTSDAADECSV